MKLVYVGNHTPWHSTESCIARAFEKLAWEVDRWQEADFNEAMAGGTDRRVHRRVLGSTILMHTLTQGSTSNREAMLDLWAACRDHGIITICVHLDVFHGLGSPKGQRGPRRSDLPREHVAFKSDYVFTPDPRDELWERDGVNHHWLPPGVDGDEARDMQAVPEEWCDETRFGYTTEPDPWLSRRLAERQFLVGFAGSDRYHREWPHRRALIDQLREWYGPRFVHVGGSSTPRITGLALNRVLASVPVWVGDSVFTRPDFAYWSDRVPECWARGGFLIHPHVDALDEHYQLAHPGVGWTVGDWDALHDSIALYLDNPVGREEVRQEFAARTRAHDTYLCRVTEILRTIGVTVDEPA